MKRITSIAILAVLCLSLALAGCSNPVYDTSYRWDATGDGETLTYDVRLRDTVLEVSATSEYVGDFLVTPEEFKQSKPVSITGTYVTNIKEVPNDALNQVLTTTLEIEESYDIVDATTSQLILSESFIEQITAKGIVVSNDGLTVVIKSTVTTTATFNRNTLRCYSSEKIVKGVYIGTMTDPNTNQSEMVQQYNEYKLTCNYDYTGKSPICNYVFTDYANPENNAESSLKFSSTTTAPSYDNCLLWLAMRSHRPTDLTGGRTIGIVEPLMFRKEATSGIVKTATGKLLLNNDGVKGEFAQYALNSNGGNFVMFCDTKQTKYIGDIAECNTYVPVKMQQGYLVLTLNQAGLDALGYTIPTEE